MIVLSICKTTAVQRAARSAATVRGPTGRGFENANRRPRRTQRGAGLKVGSGA